jgi:transposase InsO family protein
VATLQGQNNWAVVRADGTVELRDRDGSYGPAFSKRVAAMGTTEVVTAPRSPWQNAYVERVIGSVRRECLDQVVIFNERHLRHVLASYVDYYLCLVKT